MNKKSDEAHLAVERAREALRENRRGDARQLAEQAARLAPQSEDPWLILAAIASPRDSLEYIQRALKINPNSPRARKGMQWAMQRLQSEPGSPVTDETKENLALRLPPAGAQPLPAAASRAAPRARARSRIPILLVGIGVFVCVVAALSAAMSPVLASIIQQAAPTREPSWALASIPKPTYTPQSPLALVIEATPAKELSPTSPDDSPVEAAPATEPPTELAAEQPTQEIPTAEPTWSGSLSLEYVPETPTSQAPPSAATSAPGYVSTGGEHWIDVNLSQQTVTAYAGNDVANSFLVSTGTWLHPTVTGKYHIYIKLRYTDMSGADYYLPNVPYTMYFYQGYGLHGTYWHSNFGTPMSHGCVNLSIPDAEWLYNFSSVGTLVNVHY